MAALTYHIFSEFPLCLYRSYSIKTEEQTSENSTSPIHVQLAFAGSFPEQKLPRIEYRLT